jgi:two-component system, chemotaxis family, protein-glutamate methylesterase/glutaminase
MQIRVLVVDDSAFMRKLITDILQSDPKILVVGTARNGKEALASIGSLQPDVITLDVEMPEMDGLSCLKEIVKTHQTPVIMLSSLTQEGAEKTIEALAIGAFDFVGKPSGSISLNLATVGDALLMKVREAAKRKNRLTTRKIDKPQQSFIKMTSERSTNQSMASKNHQTDSLSIKLKKPDIIAIGTSTGGPRALQTVLTELPPNLPPVVIVQHMPVGFTKSLAARLNQLSQIEVCEVEDGQPLLPGQAYIAPGGLQFEVVSINHALYAKVKSLQPVNGHRPSVDVLFHSIAAIPNIQVRAAILTGMGSDGARGIERIHQIGGYTIAEAEESCVVFGMPRAAIARGGIDVVAPIQRIAAELTNYQEASIGGK